MPFVPFVPFVGDMCWSIGKPYGVGKGKEPKDRNELRHPGEGVKRERPFGFGFDPIERPIRAILPIRVKKPFDSTRICRIKTDRFTRAESRLLDLCFDAQRRAVVPFVPFVPFVEGA